jgi:hypothetical protein
MTSNFSLLVRGKVVQTTISLNEPVEIALEDIGFFRMREIISEAVGEAADLEMQNRINESSSDNSS